MFTEGKDAGIKVAEGKIAAGVEVDGRDLAVGEPRLRHFGERRRAPALRLEPLPLVRIQRLLHSDRLWARLLRSPEEIMLLVCLRRRSVLV